VSAQTSWRIAFDAAAFKDLRKLDSAARVRVLRFLQERIVTADDPRGLGKALSGDKAGFWRYRVGDYRIIARIEDQKFIVLVIAIGHRSDIYHTK
jgi:mRNA interferase RelE/StbE